MANSFESSRGNSDKSEIIPDRFGFKSAGKKYINQNYKIIGAILGVEGEWLGNIKRQAKEENQLPDIQEQEELSLEQINYYREHYDFPPLTQDELETIKSEKQPEPVVLSESEIEGGNDKKLTRADFGDIPEDPYNIKNNDLEALNSLFDAKRDEFPNSQYVDIRNWAEWTPIEVVAPENPNGKWLITKGVNHELVGDFDNETQANTEFDRIKNEDKQKALDLLKKARNFTIGEDLDTPWTDPVDVRSTTDEEVAPTQEIPEVQATDSENGGEVLPGSDELRNELNVLVEEIATQESSSVDKNSGSLQQELDRLIEVEAQKLQRDQTTENIFYQVDREKLERFKDNARQAIANYQQFSSEHSSLADKSNPQIQERYQLLEKQAWNSLYSLAHLLDGEIAVLPQDRDIQLSHLEGVDTRQYLESRGYKFDENGDITHITNKGVEIELNRAMKTESLIKSRRPSHIVYDKSISLDSDFNYQGYLVRGLNQQTPNFIVGVLDKNNLEPVIVDETGQSIPESDTSPATNPEASTEKEDPLESYRNKGFDKDKLAFIKNAIDAGDTTEQIALYAKSEYEVAQMIVEREKTLDPNLDISQYEELPYWEQIWIIACIRTGLNPEQIVPYLEEGISSDEIAEIQSDIKNGLTIEQMIKKKIIEIAKGYLNWGIGFSRYSLIEQLESKGFTDEQATQVIDSMNIDWNQEAVKSATSYLKYRREDNKNWSKNELIQQLMLENEQFTGEQARFAVNSITDYDWEEDSEVGEPEQSEVGETTPVDHPDRGSLYYQEIQLWNNIQALENRQKENPKDASIKSELDKAKQAYQEFRTDISNSTEQDKFKQFLELRESYAQAESENTRGRFWKLLRFKKNNKTELETIRSQYNEALEALLKTETSIDVEGKIKEMFSAEVQRLSRERVVQTKELQEKNQSGLDRAINPMKEQIFNWYIKNKSAVGAVNLGLFATSTFLAFTGAGIPLAGAVNTLRHTIAYPMAVASGISSRELIRSKFEDENTNLNLNQKIFKFDLKTNFEFLKFKGGITKLVDKSLQDNYIQNASDEDLSKLVSTLESYYGLNGGKFTESNQQKAYKMGLDELGARLERAYNQSTDEQDISSESSPVNSLGSKFDFRNTEEFKIKTVDGLLTRISQDRISALNAQKNKRLVANVAGTALGGSLLFNLVAQDLQLNKPSLGDSASTTNVSTPEVQSTGDDTTSAEYGPKPQTSPTQSETISTDVSTQQAKELSRDVSRLDSGETIWGEITKQLGENASQSEIQQAEAVENYLQSELGQESLYKLAQQTEGGREFLARWSIDNAGEMARLELKDLYEVSKYLGEGKLDGLTELSLDNLDALSPAEYVESSPVVEPTIEPGSTEPPAASSLEAQVETSYSELQPVETTEFNRSLSEALGATNLTEAQLQEIIHSFATSEQGSVDLYNQIISNEEGARFLSGFGVNNPADFTKLTQDQIYEIAQTIGVENLDKLPGFELNEIILSKFKDAPDMVELARGTRPLDVVQRYIANELGNLPYDANLGKQVLDTYLQTDAGKQWLYDAIVSNPNPNNQNVQLFREYLRFKGITSSEEFVNNFNWVEFSGNRNIPTSGFWNQIRLPNGGTKLQPLSTFLQPSQMPGIKEAVRQVLTRQLNN